MNIKLEDMKCLPAHQWVNAMSWKNIGNKSEEQRREFVKEAFKFQMDCIKEGMRRAAEIARNTVPTTEDAGGCESARMEILKAMNTVGK